MRAPARGCGRARVRGASSRDQSLTTMGVGGVNTLVLSVASPWGPCALGSEFDLERQLNRYKDQVASLQTNHDSSQASMLSHSMRFGESRV